MGALRWGLGACDLMQVGGALRIQVKQSAARQSWHVDDSRPPRPRFFIAHKTGCYEGAAWIAEPGRNADIFIFGWRDRNRRGFSEDCATPRNGTSSSSPRLTRPSQFLGDLLAVALSSR